MRFLSLMVSISLIMSGSIAPETQTIPSDNSTSGWSDETVGSLFPNGEIRTVTNVSLVKLPSRYHADISFDPTLGLGETVGDMSWLDAAVVHAGYITLEQQQAGLLMAFQLAGAGAACLLTAGVGCVLWSGAVAGAGYLASTEIVGVQASPEELAQHVATAMLVAGAGVALGKAVPALRTGYQNVTGTAPASGTTAGATAAGATAKANTNTGGTTSGTSNTTKTGAADDLPGVPEGAPKPLGLGSTGRTVPDNLTEQLVMEEAMSNPGSRTAGHSWLEKIGMRDDRWPGREGWQKWQYARDGITVHYAYNPSTGAVDDFKFVHP